MDQKIRMKTRGKMGYHISSNLASFIVSKLIFVNQIYMAYLCVGGIYICTKRNTMTLLLDELNYKNKQIVLDNFKRGSSLVFFF